MRLLVAAAALAAMCVSTASAQVASGVGRVPGISVQPAPVAPPPVPAPRHHGGARQHPPAPSSGRDAGAGPAPDLFLAGPKTYAPRFNRPFRRGIIPPLAPIPYLPYFPAYTTYPQPVVIVQDDVHPYVVDARERPGSPAREMPDAAPGPAPASADPPRPVVAAKPKTLYVIPRCYAGDRRPLADELPKGCDIGALRVIPPRAS